MKEGIEKKMKEMQEMQEIAIESIESSTAVKQVNRNMVKVPLAANEATKDAVRNSHESYPYWK